MEELLILLTLASVGQFLYIFSLHWWLYKNMSEFRRDDISKDINSKDNYSKTNDSFPVRITPILNYIKYKQRHSRYLYKNLSQLTNAVHGLYKIVNNEIVKK